MLETSNRIVKLTMHTLNNTTAKGIIPKVVMKTSQVELPLPQEIDGLSGVRGWKPFPSSGPFGLRIIITFQLLLSSEKLLRRLRSLSGRRRSLQMKSLMIKGKTDSTEAV